MRVTDELSVDLQIGSMLFLGRILPKAQLKRACALVHLLSISTRCLLETQRPDSTKGKELKLAIRMGLLSKLFPGQMIPGLSIFPNIYNSSHKAIYVHG